MRYCYDTLSNKVIFCVNRRCDGGVVFKYVQLTESKFCVVCIRVM